MKKISVRFNGIPEVYTILLDTSLANIFSEQRKFMWSGIGMVQIMDEATLHINQRDYIEKDEAEYLLDGLQAAFLFAETARMKIAAIPRPSSLNIDGYASRIELICDDEDPITCAIWHSAIQGNQLHRFFSGNGLIPINSDYIHFLRPGTLTVFARPSVAVHMDTVMHAVRDRKRDVFFIKKGYRGREDEDLYYEDQNRREEQEQEAYRSQPCFGEAGLVTEWGRHFFPDQDRYTANIPILRLLDDLGRESCIGILANNAFSKTPTFAISAERALIRAWQIGRHGKDEAERLRFTHLPEDVRLALKDRAKAVVGVTSQERRAGEFATTRAIMRAVALEAWIMGDGMARGETPNLEPRYLEECCLAMRVVPANWRQSYLDASVSDKPITWSKHRPSHNLPEDTHKTFLKQGLMTEDKCLTPAGKAIAETERAWQTRERPSISSLAILTPRDPDLAIPEPDLTVKNFSWRTIPDGIPEETLFLSSTLRLLPDIAPDLLPDGMTIVTDQNALIIQLRGHDVLRLGHDPDGAGTLMVDDFPEASDSLTLRRNEDLSCRLRKEADGDHIQLLRRGQVIAVTKVDPVGDGQILRIEGFRPVPPDAVLPAEAIAAFVNKTMKRRMNAFPQLAGVPLCDGLKFIHGSEDPRLIKLLAQIDGDLRNRLAVNVEPTENDQIESAVNDFFSP